MGILRLERKTNFRRENRGPYQGQTGYGPRIQRLSFSGLLDRSLVKLEMRLAELVDHIIAGHLEALGLG